MKRLAVLSLSALVLVGGQTLGSAPQAVAATPAAATVTGTVIDSVTQAPLPNASVTDAIGSRTVQTDASGTYSLAVSSPPTKHRVTAEHAGYEWSDQTTIVPLPNSTITQDFSLVPAATPTINGTPYVGQTLTASVAAGTWNPAPAMTTWQWYADGAAMSAATATSLTLTPAETGKAITVSVTMTLTGYVPVTTVSAPTAAVAIAQVTPGTVSIGGAVEVGSALTATTSGWVPTDAALSYQWLSDGGPITAATLDGYVVGAGDVGHMLSVTVTGSADGYQPVSVTSAQTVAVPAVVLPSVAPGTLTIEGAAEVGGTLTAATSGWAPDGVSLTYQWLLDATTPIDGATFATYTPVAGDLGHTLAVSVTGTMSGYTSATVVSSSTTSVGATPGSFRSLAPSRLLDTRISGPSLGWGATRSLQVTGAGGVPSTGVSAVVLNVTVTDTTSSGYLTVSPSGTLRPVVSNLNWTAGETIPNAVTVKVGTNGQVDLFQSGPGTAQVVVDVAGYFVDGTVTQAGGFTSLAPSRILDTRTQGGPVGWGQARDLVILGAGGVPADNVSAVVLNVTVTDTTASGFLTVFPSGTDRPNASNLNWSAGVTIPNLVTVKVGSNGSVSLFQSGPGTAQVVVDVAGYYLGGTPTQVGMFVALAPARVMDTRTSSPVAAFSAVALSILGMGGVPSTGVSAVVVNTTVTETHAAGYLTVFLGTGSLPLASNLNWSTAGTTIPNLVTVQVGGDGTITFHNASVGTTQVVADVAGYYLGS